MLFNKPLKSTVLLFGIIIFCGNTSEKKSNFIKLEDTSKARDCNTQKTIVVGANRTAEYLPILKDKKIALVANPTSVIFKNKNSTKYTHLVDSLLKLGVAVEKIFALEHGFRGNADAGKAIQNDIDKKTGIPIVSLYGKKKKPSALDLKNIQLIIFDIQDVGARFYTYISSLHYIMEAAARFQIPILILDRPNPNGHYIDGPVLEMKNKSFVGMHPVPIVHGMTIGEYASMINGEGWLSGKFSCNLRVIKCKNYTHQTPYSLPIKPSPNLPNDKAINLYPSLCFFEGTNVNVGRGTKLQFQSYGSPFLKIINYQYVPKPNKGAKHPKHQEKICYGENLSNAEKLNTLKLDWLINAYKNTSNQKKFFNSFFIKLAGTDKLQKQIIRGFSSKQIKETWKADLKKYQKIRAKYLIYPIS